MRRRLIAATLTATALAVAGCGSSHGSGAANPTADALSYFPSETPFVATIATDPNAPALKRAKALQRRSPGATLLETALFAALAKLGVNYNRDVRPLLGNRVAVGAASTVTSGTQAPALAAWRTKSATKLGALVHKLPGLQRTGTRDGAKLYRSSSLALGIDGPTIVVSRTTQDVEAALDRHAHKRGFSAADYARDTAGVSHASAVVMVGSLTGALSTADASAARQVPWIAAIRGYGAALDTSAHSVTLQFHIDTGGRSVTSSQLPFATGPGAPGLSGVLPILIGIRDPAQLWTFGVNAAHAADPASYGKLVARETKIKHRTGVDVNDLMSKLTGDLDLTSDAHTTVARVQVSDPGAVSSMIARLMRAPGTVFRPGATVHRVGHGLYVLHEPSTTLTLGVVGDKLAFGRATPAEIRSYATASATPAAGATGAVAFKLALPELLHLTLKRPPPPVAQRLLAGLGDLTGSVRAATSGLVGRATLSLR